MFFASTHRFVARLVLLSLFLTLAGCGSGGGGSSSMSGGASSSTGTKSTGGAKKKLRIAVIPKGTTHEFWKSVHAGARQAAEELGDVEILWKGPVNENDRDAQISVVQEFVVQKVDGICLAPLDSRALVSYVEESVEKGVPVVIFDSGLDDEKHIVSYVATDNFEGGKLAARTLAAAMGGKGNAILLRYLKGSESTQQREDGFLACLKAEFPQIQVISSDQYIGSSPEESDANTQTVLRKFKQEVDGLFTVCEPNATGALKALQELELATKVKFVAFDPNAPLIAGLKSQPPKVNGIVLQDPVKMGYASIMAMVKHLRGEAVEKRISTGEAVATPDNTETPEMVRLLKPAQYDGK